MMKTLMCSVALAASLVIAGCSDSNNSGGSLLGGGGTVQNDGPSNACTQNVSGCEAAAFSCGTAGFCYELESDCAQSGECGTSATGGNNVIGTGTDDGLDPPFLDTTSGGSCTTNVLGCDANAFSCDAAQFCYATSADCQQSNECPI